jgi:hypothetical protein
MQLVPLVEARHPRVLGEELEREAERIDDSHRLADAARGAGRTALDLAAVLAIPAFGATEVGRFPHSIRHAPRRRAVAETQDDRMVDGLFVATQVDGVGILGRHDEAEHVDPEPARLGKVGDDQLDVRRADDVGRRGVHQLTPNLGTWVSPRATWTIVVSV